MDARNRSCVDCDDDNFEANTCKECGLPACVGCVLDFLALASLILMLALVIGGYSGCGCTQRTRPTATPELASEVFESPIADMVPPTTTDVPPEACCPPEESGSPDPQDDEVSDTSDDVVTNDGDPKIDPKPVEDDSDVGEDPQVSVDDVDEPKELGVDLKDGDEETLYENQGVALKIRRVGENLQVWCTCNHGATWSLSCCKGCK